jgi:hypothetical protein
MVFEVFRKRQKEMLAVLVLLAMFSFIAGDFLYRYVRGDGPGSDGRFGEVWNKPVTATDIQRLAADRESAYGAMARMVKAAGASAKPELAHDLFNMTFWQNFEQERHGLMTFVFYAFEGKADRLGIKITDEDVTQFLKKVTGDALTRDQFKEALSPPRRSGQRSSDRGEAVSASEFYRIVAREMKVRRTLDALSSSFDGTLPIDYWRGLMEDARTLISLEMVRVPADRFIDAKALPTDKELQPIYNRYKNTVADPDRGVIGFLRPATAEFEYVSIPVEKWLDQVKVTEEECKAEYDANPNDYRDEIPLPTPPASVNQPKDGDKKGEMPKKEVPPPSKGPLKQPELTKEPPKGDLKKMDPVKETPKVKADPKASPPDKKTGASPSASLLRAIAATSVYVPMQDAKKSEDKKTEPAKGDGKKEDKKADDKKGEGWKPSEKKLEFPADKGKQEPPKPEPPGVGKAQVGEGVKPPPIKPYLTVKAEIERKLKMRKARVLLREKVKAVVEGPLAKHAEAVILERHKHETKGGKPEDFVPPPPPRTMESLKQEFRGDYHHIGPTTEADVRKMPGFGRLYDPTSNPVTKIFDPQTQPYSAESAVGIDENEFYIYWRTKYKPAAPLEFEAVREQMATIWRQEQAQKPAEKAAEELAEKVKKVGFAEALKGTDYKSFQPGSFRRTNYYPGEFGAKFLSMMRSVPNTQLVGVPDAKQAFIQEAFEMEEGEVKVIPGDERKNFYVAKCIKREPPKFDDFADEYEFLVQRQRLMGMSGGTSRNRGLAVRQVLAESGFLDDRTKEPERPSSTEEAEKREAAERAKSAPQ